MDPQDIPATDAPLTVNEQPLGSCTLKYPAKDNQVIVMSGHETIRVLEVEVDQASLPSSVPDGRTDSGGEDGGNQATEEPEAGMQDSQRPPHNAGGVGEPFVGYRYVLEDQVVSVESADSGVQTLAQTAVPISVSLSQSQTTMPITVQSLQGLQGCQQVLTQEGLATLMTGMMAQTGSLAQPLLISMAGSMGGQGGLAVLTFPTSNVATLPGISGASQAGSLLKLPFAGLQGLHGLQGLQGLQTATVLNSVQPQQTVFQPQTASLQQVQAAMQQAQQTVFQPQTASLQQVQAAMQQAQQNSQVTAAQLGQAMPAVSQPSVSVATLQSAGLSINPAIISAASLGAQPQFISALTSTPIFTSAMSGITSQIITNAQGQVIGTIPLMLNPASLTGGAATQTLNLQGLQGLQVQTVQPQLVLNTQGQIIATIGNGPATVPTSAAVMPKLSAPVTFSKPSTQAQVTTVTQSPVVIAPQPSAMKTVTPISSSFPITCGDTPTVNQLVSKPQQGGTDEEGINLEEIREFAKNFKIRRLSLGLTQTQVGQALTATEGPAYSQSAICRFEKLDITPKSAQKLKPVLERWLAEAELWNQKGQQNLMEFVGGEPSKKRKRRTSFTPQAIEVLNTYFEKNALPTGQEITEIAKELNYDREVVRVWFCNRRQTLKNTSKINAFQVQL
ncbi:POU domain, class 6, transcription factor 1-like isoform X1 [Oncorhynchus nerka]|uniref:POU domain, class 6, transcription factor 1-like isoform X1 n=1 Tax=Oncorhynchus nerka TaxID=8023 RepID=UPI001130AE38|nr:POU domain, class 6, transcription factor 1-like isoform X1 [Oncorhynchus nerka]XP_029520868.1 POU domain, class 6, transcription factor 1-like isoform X1 [Oncorhynchus nerka]